ncbi:MAG: CopG family transcriptional regulator [Desulfurococcales archaeon ex4484_42]|mgnify:CR=1 FL=1|nr:MAG: CopG family transcriptional regulator [Desulfurococcales archaeon ex4484_42]
MSSDKVPVYVKKELYEKVEKFIKDQGGFSSVEEFIEFVINEVLSEEVTEYKMSKEEEEKVKERLKALGYF